MFGNEAQSSRSGAIDKFHNLFSFEKCMSKTVKCEIDNRISVVTRFIDQLSKKFIVEFRSFKAESPTANLSDLSFIESFFLARKDGHSTGSTEREIIENMESAIAVLLVENYKCKKPLKTDDFILYAAEEFDKVLTKIKLNFNAKLGTYRVFHEQADPSIRKKLENEPEMKRTVEKKPSDIDILCEVEAYQKSSGKTCLLATTDCTDFLDNRSVIELLIGVKCIDPVYLPNELEK